MAIDDLIQDATRRMDKSVEAAQAEFATLRTGRASPAPLDRVQIDYYGQKTPLKQLTGERRKELVKIVRGMAEAGRVAVRNVRRDVMHHLEELVDNGEVGSDEEHRAEERVQKLTDDHTQKIDDLLKRKEEEILEV